MSKATKLNFTSPSRSKRKNRRRSINQRRPMHFRPSMDKLEERNLLATIAVLNLDDSGPGSLRDAVEEANALPGQDTIRFARGLSGTIELESQIHITDDLDIRGPGANKITVSGESTNDEGESSRTRVFAVIPAELDDDPNVVPTLAQVATSPTVSIQKLTIADGLATDAPGFDPDDPNTPFALGAGIYNLGGTVNLDRVHIIGHETRHLIAAGGAVSNQYGGTFTATRSHFEDNWSNGVLIGASGAMNADLSVATDGTTGTPTVIISRSSFVGNHATSGLGYIDGVPFSGFAAAGAVLMETGYLSIQSSHFEGNYVEGGTGGEGSTSGGPAFGGAVASTDVSPLGVGDAVIEIRGSKFINNWATGGDGGVEGVPGGRATGGAIAAINGSEAILVGNKFRGNSVTGGDGGEDADGAMATGGAVSASSAAELNLQRNQFGNNTARGGSGSGDGASATGRGGAVGIENLPLTGLLEGTGTGRIQNDAYRNNTAFGGFGGAIFNEGDLTISNSSLKGNLSLGLADVRSGVPGYDFAGVAVGGGLSNVGTLDVIATRFEANQAVGASDAEGTNFLSGAAPLYAGLAVGGGMHSFTEATVTRSQFIRNVALGGDGNVGTFSGIGAGGGIYNDGELTIRRGTFVGNLALGGNENSADVSPGGGLGGAIASGSVTASAGLRSGDLTIERSQFRGNRAVGGDDNENDAAILPVVPTAHLAGLGGGGAIFVYEGTANITRSNLRQNRATGGNNGPALGGGLYSLSLVGSVEARVSQSRIERNAAVAGDSSDALGGGIATGSFGSLFGADGNLTVHRSVVNRNIARGGDEGDGLGGGIFNDEDALLNLLRSTIFGNRAIEGDDGEGIGGGLYNEGTLKEVLAQIFANFATTSDDDCFGC